MLRPVFAIALLTLLSIVTLPQSAIAPTESRRFTVAEDIGLTHIASPIQFSPDNRYFLVKSDRGLVDLNRAESSIRVYGARDVSDFLSHPGWIGELAPVWILGKSTCKTGPVINDLRWLADSSGFAFLAKTVSGNDQLFLADLRAKRVKPLTPESQHVTGFDVHSKKQFVYTVLSPTIQEMAVRQKHAAAISGTGRGLYSLLFPENAASPDVDWHDLSELWAVIDDKRFRVVETPSNHPVPVHLDGQKALALSPDGRSVLTALTISDVPAEWEALYPPRVPSYPYRVRAGSQHADGLMGQNDVSEYALVDLHTGKARSLTQAPIGRTAGWSGSSHTDWSADGHSVVLSNTFLPPGKRQSTTKANKPCVVIADLTTHTVVCLERSGEGIDARNKDDWQYISDAHFVNGNKDIVLVTYSQHGETLWSTTFAKHADGSWKPEAGEGELAGSVDLPRIFIKEDLNEPPVLMAEDKGMNASQVIWDPNPQLKGIELGHVSVFKWMDKNGRDWVGGLYTPPGYIPGRRYPLVIQTHGFSEHKFLPSGAYPTNFAAQELAGVGFLVLQVQDCPIRVRPEEAPCQVAGYEAAVERLASEGLVDPERTGIIGFSRTCYYVLETLTTSARHFRAASIADGINEGYFLYMIDRDLDEQGRSVPEADTIIGTPPFGPGLDLWLARSPEFNMHKVTTPLQVLATNGPGILRMWEPYAALRYLHKPVDLIILNSAEHVFTNPEERLISQGATIDWFRFWLQDYEDPDPTKVEQYNRWRVLRAPPEPEAKGRAPSN